ncbi:hypothetical protein C8J57DRAFT_1457974 [Mycena rebaudengoi]|nr:hypothetical protein C8J57DRAFT_1457974 [Mycena rebaudengoi]
MAWPQASRTLLSSFLQPPPDELSMRPPASARLSLGLAPRTLPQYQQRYPNGAFAGFLATFSPSTSAFPHSTSASAFQPSTSISAFPPSASAFGITPSADASSSSTSGLYPALAASPPVDNITHGRVTRTGFGSGGATPFGFAVPARAADGVDGAHGGENGTNGGTTDQTKAEILAELDQHVFGGSAIRFLLLRSARWGVRASQGWGGNASVDVGGAVNTSHISGGKPPVAPGRFDKAHAAAFARMESIAAGTSGGGLKRKASAGDGGLGGKRARVESGAAQTNDSSRGHEQRGRRERHGAERQGQGRRKAARGAAAARGEPRAEEEQVPWAGRKTQADEAPRVLCARGEAGERRVGESGSGGGGIDECECYGEYDFDWRGLIWHRHRMRVGHPRGVLQARANNGTGPNAGANANSGLGGPSSVNAGGASANTSGLAAPSSATRLRAPSVRSVASTASGRARSPLPPSFGGAGARGSGVMRTRNSGSSMGTRSSTRASMGTKTSSVASSMGTRISSMGTRTSSMGTRTMSFVAGSSIGVGARARDGSLGTRGSVSSAASKARPTSRLLAPTASSLAKMSGGVLEGITNASSQATATGRAKRRRARSSSLRAGRAPATGRSARGGACRLLHPRRARRQGCCASSLAKTIGGVLEGITNAGSPAPPSAAGEGEAAPRKKLLPARKPRISPSRVIAKLASQRAASASSAASAASGSGAQRKSHGGGGRACSSMGAKVLRGSMGGMKNGGGGGGLGAGGADAKRRVRQSEYYARRRSRGAGGADANAMVVDE